MHHTGYLLLLCFVASQSWINQMSVGNDAGWGLWSFILVSIGSFTALLSRTLLVTLGSLNASR